MEQTILIKTGRWYVRKYLIALDRKNRAEYFGEMDPSVLELKNAETVIALAKDDMAAALGQVTVQEIVEAYA